MVAKLRMHIALFAGMPLVVLALGAALSLVPTRATATGGPLCGESWAPACNGDCPTGQVCVPTGELDQSGSLADECATTGPAGAECVPMPSCECIEAGAGVTRSLLGVQR
jgi:hypothetical protein